MKRSLNIAVAGKGGTGKSTVSSLLVKGLVETRKGLVLAIDADPNYNLDVKLGLEVDRTIGDLREEMRESGDENPGGMSKSEYVKYQLRILLQEGKNLDLLVMGRQEGTGCYCYINNVLRHFIDNLSKEYRYIVIDNDAGMEHLSRRTDEHMDMMLITSDGTKVGIETAARIRDMAIKMKLIHGKIILIVNNVEGELQPFLNETIAGFDFQYVHIIHRDQEVFNRNAEGLSLLDISTANLAYGEVRKVIGDHLGV